MIIIWVMYQHTKHFLKRNKVKIRALSFGAKKFVEAASGFHFSTKMKEMIFLTLRVNINIRTLCEFT